ncbi:MAG: hypothetical protein Q7U18_05605 [Methylobacter sp.]|nr:hypothetical protein [Methylobacter sp.]
MSENLQETIPELPSTDEIQDALEKASILREEVDHYRSTAQEIDDEFKRANEDRHPTLDDMPYGEELIRTRELPHRLDQAIGLLTQIDEKKLSPKDASDAFEEAETIIEDARNTIDDCTALPPEEEDE